MDAHLKPATCTVAINTGYHDTAIVSHQSTRTMHSSSKHTPVKYTAVWGLAALHRQARAAARPLIPQVRGRSFHRGPCTGSLQAALQCPHLLRTQPRRLAARASTALLAAVPPMPPIAHHGALLLSTHPAQATGRDGEHSAGMLVRWLIACVRAYLSSEAAVIRTRTVALPMARYISPSPAG